MADPMNISPANPGLTPQQWDSEFYSEYVRENQFFPLMGTDENAIIQVKEDLARRPGDRITFAFVGRLVGAGVRGSQVLRGNEEILNDRSMVVRIIPIRHAVAIDKWQAKKSAIDKRQAARAALKNWAVELMRGDTIQAMFSVNGVPYPVATAAQRDLWLTDNSDRVLIGDKRSNTTTTMATSLANLSATSGKMTRRTLELAKRMARAANPRIRPLRTRKGSDSFAVYLHPLAFRDLRNDPEMREDLRMAAERGADNPLWSGGDLMVDGMVIKEEPEFISLPGPTAGVKVAQGVLLGAQALGYAVAQRTESTEDVYDYGWENGVGVEEIRGIEKLQFGKSPTADTGNLVDHGVVTMFSSVTDDA